MAIVRFSILAFGMLCLALSGLSATAAAEETPGKIFPYPGSGEADLVRPHELKFALPNDGVARAEFRSETFFAIVLKSARPCALTEQDRLEIQALFVSNKVFMNRFGCDNDVEESLTYTNVDPDFSFIAVHGGSTKQEAQKLLDEQSIAQRFPGANIRKMQAVLVYP